MNVEQGSECYIHYCENPQMLFTEGLHLLVKIEENVPFQSVNKLSLGQQSQVIVCLSLAIASLSPIPMLYIDEIDASLDALAVSNLAQLVIRNPTLQNTHIVAVSHHPNFYEAFKRIVGVYSLGAVGSHVLTKDFETALYEV
eukprot:GHVN01053166.1.p1 GENE.GHVN01053166.1~~GHVN01053166.1.p1  ORF type:complete len:142 (-),score=24.22 GHVN01053166.1:34-459(-)